MAAKTPNSVWRENAGSENMIVASFTSTTLDDGDTWTQTVPGYTSHDFQQKNNPSTQAAAGVSVAYSSGVFTFYPGENGATGTLHIHVSA